MRSLRRARLRVGAYSLKSLMTVVLAREQSVAAALTLPPRGLLREGEREELAGKG